MKQGFLSHKSGFTLVEMLIVIVIIGILASALIPRLSQAQERANDTARKAHIQNIATVLIAYQIDRWSYPDTPWSVSAMESALVGAWLSSVPTDPSPSRSFVGIGTSDSSCSPSPAGEYMYTPITKRGIPRAGFVLMAGTQTEWWSNWIYQSDLTTANYVGNGCLHPGTNFATIQECDVFSDGTTNLEECRYNNQSDVLRYIYRQ